jgi:uncharacterized protein GlcG (DUF336 family)
MPRLTLELADRLSEAAIAISQERGWRVAIAIVDDAGNPVRITRMDGCNFLLPDLARAKAYGAVAWQRPSAELAALFGGNTALAAWGVAMTGNRVMPMQGALPIWDGDQCIGAMGISGARAEEDESVARASIEATGFSAALS